MINIYFDSSETSIIFIGLFLDKCVISFFIKFTNSMESIYCYQILYIVYYISIYI